MASTFKLGGIRVIAALFVGGPWNGRRALVEVTDSTDLSKIHLAELRIRFLEFAEALQIGDVPDEADPAYRRRDDAFDPMSGLPAIAVYEWRLIT